jgi:hypothetical protein
MEVVSVRTVTRSISAGVGALLIGFAVKSGGMPSGPVKAGLQGERASISDIGTIGAETVDSPPSVGSQIPVRPRVRLASLESELDSGTAADEAETQAKAPPSTNHASFDERFSSSFDERVGSSFDERFGSSSDAHGSSFDERFGSSVAEQPRDDDESVVFGGPVWPMPLADALQPPVRTLASPAQPHKNGALPADQAKREPVPPAVGQRAPESAMVTPPSPPAASKTSIPTADARVESILPSDSQNHTAIYDIAAHVVYLPNGERLEAHSGLGSNLDNPNSVGVKGRGATPPNVYDLVLRKQPFHGVQAIRLIPVGEGKMFGRDGMLAHSYMLGPNGQSNGCVSFSNYQAFLNAYLKGNVERLVVVEHLAAAPPPKASSGWLPEAIRNLFNPS